jgi:hypothetical protein
MNAKAAGLAARSQGATNVAFSQANYFKPLLTVDYSI